MRGEEGRTVVDAIPAEEAGLADPVALGHHARLGELLPVVGRRALASGEPENTAMELRQRVVETERLVGVALQAGGAVVVGAGADQPTAGREQCPAARDIGEAFFL